MITAGSIIDALGGTGEVAEALSLSDSIVSGWRKRGIPGPRWRSLVQLASDRGRTDITLDLLAELAAREPAEARV